MGSGGSRQKPGGRGQQASLMEEARVHALGKDLVSRLAMLLKTVRIHSAHNQALRYSVKIFVQSANSLAQHLGDFTLRGDADSVFINEIRIRPEPIVWENIVQLMAELNRRGAGGLNFTGAILPATARGLLEVLMEYEELDASEGAQTLNAALHSSGITTVSFLPRLTLVTEAPAFAEQEIARATRAIQIYTELLVTWQAYLAIQDPHVPDVIRGRLLTAVQASVDMLHEDPEWFISAACFRKPEGYQAVHAVNTAILSMALGYFMDLKRKPIMNLAMSALYASAGLRRFGVSSTMEVQPDSEAASRGIEIYPLCSVKEILQTPALTRAQRDRIVVAFEHRMGSDGSGFPPRIPGKPKHLFSSIVSICGDYDRLTSDFADHEALSPTAALESMTERVTAYDRRLLAVFMYLMGPYPIGTLVELSTGEIAVVFRPNPDRRYAGRPLVKVIQDSQGRAVPPSLFDLTDGNTGGSFLAHIKETLPSSAVPGVQPVQAIFAQAAVEQARPRWDAGS